MLGPRVNGRWLNVFTGAVIAVPVTLSLILTVSVLYSDMGEPAILAILGGGMLFTLSIAAAVLVIRRHDRRIWTDAFERMIWRMPPLDQLPPAHMTQLTRIWLAVLRGYLVVRTPREKKPIRVAYIATPLGAEWRVEIKRTPPAKAVFRPAV